MRPSIHHIHVTRLFIRLFAATALVSAPGCLSDKRGDTVVDSETHFFSGCTVDTMCDEGLSCICGVCTEYCGDVDSCEELAPGAVCHDSITTGGFECVNDQQDASFCVDSCSSDLDCGPGSCNGGVCVPAVPTVVPTAEGAMPMTFQRVQPLGAFAAVKGADGRWTRHCGSGPVDGVLTDFTLVGGRFYSGVASDSTRVTAPIRPGSLVAGGVVGGDGPTDIRLVSSDHVSLTVACLEGGVDGTCSGAGTPEVAGVGFEAQADAVHKHNIIVLIDQSGSVGGIVDPLAGMTENAVGDFVPPSDFGNVASDRWSVRLSAVRRFLRGLGSDANVGILQFGNGGNTSADVPCVNAAGEPRDSLAECFGAIDHWLELPGLSSLQGQMLGRANLWETVLSAHSFLVNDLADATRSNHVVVISDGPDTCSGENLGLCQAPCSATDVNTVLAALEQDADNPATPSVQVHFVQFESPGYGGRDPQQIKVACASGGHYHYINTSTFPSSQQSQMLAAVELGFDRIQDALVGHWQLATPLDAFAVAASAGNLFTVEGEVSVHPASGLVDFTSTARFAEGQTESAPTWDERFVLAKPCASEADCGGVDLDCQVDCSPESGLCIGGSAAAVSLADTMPCTKGDGQPGVCCGGTCFDEGTTCPDCF